MNVTACSRAEALYLCFHYPDSPRFVLLVEKWMLSP